MTIQSHDDDRKHDATFTPSDDASFDVVTTMSPPPPRVSAEARSPEAQPDASNAAQQRMDALAAQIGDRQAAKVLRQLDWYFGRLHAKADAPKPPSVAVAEPPAPQLRRDDEGQKPAMFEPVAVKRPSLPTDATFSPVHTPVPLADIVTPDRPLPVPPPLPKASPPLPPPLPKPTPPPLPPAPQLRRADPPSIFARVAGRIADSLANAKDANIAYGIPTPKAADAIQGVASAMAGREPAPVTAPNAGGVHIEPAQPDGKLSFAGKLAVDIEESQRSARAYGLPSSPFMAGLGAFAKVASSWLGDKHTFGEKLRDRMRTPAVADRVSASMANVYAAPQQTTATSITPGAPDAGPMFMPATPAPSTVSWLPPGMAGTATFGGAHLAPMMSAPATAQTFAGSFGATSKSTGTTFAPGGGVPSQSADGGMRELLAEVRAIRDMLKNMKSKDGKDESESIDNRRPDVTDLDNKQLVQRAEPSPTARTLGSPGIMRPPHPSATESGGIMDTVMGVVKFFI